MAPKKPMNSYFTAQDDMDNEAHICIQGNRKVCRSLLRQSLSQERHVVFAELVAVIEAPASNNKSDSAFGCVWWTWEEYKKIANNNRITLRKMMADKSFSDDDAEFCSLGLQRYAENENKKRRNHKQRVARAILKAQALQRKEGMHDTVYLAELSRACTKTSREQAFLRAFTDRETPQELVLQYQMNELNFTDFDLVEVKMHLH
jgi:hypothetical protein